MSTKTASSWICYSVNDRPGGHQCELWAHTDNHLPWISQVVADVMMIMHVI